MGTPQAHCRTQHCEDFWEWFPETNFVFNFVDEGNSYVATIGIVMRNMHSNCVMCTLPYKPICSVLQTEVHSNFLPRSCLQNLFHLAWTSCLFCFLRLSYSG